MKLIPGQGNVCQGPGFKQVKYNTLKLHLLTCIIKFGALFSNMHISAWAHICTFLISDRHAHYYICTLLQVFPLLIQKLSTEVQASLIWQFICSVPILLLEEVLPWMVSFLPADKQAEVTQCINEIAPMEKALQEVSRGSVLNLFL